VSRETRTRLRRLVLAFAFGAIFANQLPSVANTAIPAFLFAYLLFDLWGDYREHVSEGAE
jgi:hypothetical protein